MGDDSDHGGSSNSSLIENIHAVDCNLQSCKSVFELMIFSEAGKPIYSFSKREDAVTLMPLCSALLDYASKTQKDILQSITTSDNLIINFAKRSPLIIIVIHHKNSFIDAMLLVEQVEAQLISILTLKTIKSVFEERPTFDLKRLLYGSEKLIDAVTNITAFTMKLEWPWVESYITVTSSIHAPSDNLPPKILNQSLPNKAHRVLIPTVMMPASTRDNLHSILSNVISSRSKNMVFSLLFRTSCKIASDDEPQDQSNDENSSEKDHDESRSDKIPPANRYKLVTVCNHHANHKLKVADIHILTALLYGSSAQLQTAESLWLPVCLPKFNCDAFLHTYISLINNSKFCLVMLSIDREEFSDCQKSRLIIEDKIQDLLNDSNQRNKICYQISPPVHSILLESQDRLINDQMTPDELSEMQQKMQIYNTKAELYHTRQLRFLWYQNNRQVLWWQRSGRYEPDPIIFYMTKKMLESSLKHLWIKVDKAIFLGWHVPTFQLYAQFDDSITTNDATEVIQRITNWLRKEADNFSIKDYRG